MSAAAGICPKGIIFDLDGTLYRMRWYLRAALSWKLFPAVLRLPRFLRVRNRFAGIDMGTHEHLLDELSLVLAGVENCSAGEIRTWIEESFYPAFIGAMKFFRNSRPGLAELICGLRKCGIVTGVLSDYDFVNERLERLGIDGSLFDAMMSSEALGALKPSPIPFLSMARSWRIEPSEIMVVGDRDDTDGAAARAAGMTFWGIADSRPIDTPFRSWDQIKGELLSFCRAGA